jgi:SAM-dependent methyltransferase
LVKQLGLEPQAQILDVACGKGRHAIYLNKLGFNVTGIDLSDNSIAHSKQFENPSLHFYVHDMRRLFRTNSFDLLLNLFTSFGYFERQHHNAMAINAWAAALKSGGKLVIDF